MSKRYRINLSDRTIAGAILLRLANHPEEHHDRFCLSYAYEYDSDFLSAVGRDLGIESVPCIPYLRRLRKVCRRLEYGGVLYGRVSSCHAEYIGEPRTLKSYAFCDPGYAMRLSPERWPHYKPMGNVETELKILLDRCFPEESNATN